MCRLFGMLSGAPAAAGRWLVEGDRSLLTQAKVSEHEAQGEGWGIGWYGDARTPRIEKGSAGAFDPAEIGRFRDVAGRAVGPVVVAHLRKASNPMHLPRERLLGTENSQPFSSGADLFAHNGMIPLPRETRPKLGRFEGRVRGVNDSEVLFWLFARHLEEIGDPPEAFVRTVRDLRSVWEAKGRPEGGPYSGLNVVFTRGPNDLWAFCHWLGDHGPGLRDRSRPYYQMAYRADSKIVVVGSEPLDAEVVWRPLSDGEYLHAQSSHGLVALRTGRLDLPVAAGGPPSARVLGTGGTAARAS